MLRPKGTADNLVITLGINYSQLAIQACLEFAKISAANVDEVCFGLQRAGALYRHDLKVYASGRDALVIGNFLVEK